jgi:hypothetical protein
MKIEKSGNTKGVIRRRKSKDRQRNVQNKKKTKGKQWDTKHYTKNEI